VLDTAAANDRPESKDQVQAQSDRQAQRSQRTRCKLIRGKDSEANEADQVNGFIKTRSLLVTAKGLDAWSHPPPSGVMAAEALLNKVTASRHVRLDQQRN
jgi:hypothetical protein